MTVPNVITMVRIALVPVFMAVYLSGAPYSDYAALAIFLAASATDGVDGYIARKYNLVTNFGKFVDPLADKLLITAGLILLVEAGRLASWAAVLILAREFAVTSLRTVAMSEGRVVAAGMSGKVKMVVQVVCVSVMLTGLCLIPLFGWVTLGDLLGWIMTAVTVFSGVDYFWSNRDVFGKTRA